jgi:hypothetical protein
METCSSYRPWHDKASGKTFFKPITGKCLHDYFYFIDAQFGLCYVRVPTWAPFRLPVYFNGHGWLARQLTQAGIAFESADNALLAIADPRRRPTSCRRPRCHHAASPPRAMGTALLPGLAAFPPRRALELHASRVRHRCGVPQTGQIPIPLRGHRAHRCARG